MKKICKFCVWILAFIGILTCINAGIMYYKYWEFKDKVETIHMAYKDQIDAFEGKKGALFDVIREDREHLFKSILMSIREGNKKRIKFVFGQAKPDPYTVQMLIKKKKMFDQLEIVYPEYFTKEE